jgi:hypothetical protein
VRVSWPASVRGWYDVHHVWRVLAQVAHSLAKCCCASPHAVHLVQIPSVILLDLEVADRAIAQRRYVR